MSLRFSHRWGLVLLSLGASFALGFLGIGNLLQASVLNPYVDASSYEEVTVAYHLKINDIVNAHLKKLTADGATPDVSYPGSPDNCSEDNVSTFCLAVRMNAEYDLFKAEMLKRTDEFEPLESGTYLDQAINADRSRGESIEREINNAALAMDLLLSGYNQIQVVYPVHRELGTLFQNLEAFRDELANTRDIVEKFPARFNDAVTLECQ